MATTKTCDRCAHYTPAESYMIRKHAGACALIGDTNDDHEAPAADRVAGWDYEGYRAGAYVGPKFGCIHFTKKAQP